jgi:hypothetical protein
VKVTRFEGDETKSDEWPWWTLVEAIRWIVGEENIEGPPAPVEGASPEEVNAFLAWNDGDLDYSAREWAAKELRTALAQGRVTAYGLRSHSEKAEEIEAVEWNSRQVPISRFAGMKSWQEEPYNIVVVHKDEVKRCWPVPFWEDKQPARRGRPEEFDWQRIVEIADEERRNSPSARQLELIVQARCHSDLRYPEGKPSLTAIRNHLKAAR